MINIDNGITYSPTGHNNSNDRAQETGNWNIEMAKEEAKRHGLVIGDDHLDVIHFLRNYYVENGWPKRVHVLSRILDKAFRHTGGKRYLHQLFPGGPLRQGGSIGRAARNQ
jgi:tRNA 2-thiouridine synthesizing protein E